MKMKKDSLRKARDVDPSAEKSRKDIVIIFYAFGGFRRNTTGCRSLCID
jgi:hypothetical protein